VVHPHEGSIVSAAEGYTDAAKRAKTRATRLIDDHRPPAATPQAEVKGEPDSEPRRRGAMDEQGLGFPQQRSSKPALRAL